MLKLKVPDIGYSDMVNQNEKEPVSSKGSSFAGWEAGCRNSSQEKWSSNE